MIEPPKMKFCKDCGVDRPTRKFYKLAKGNLSTYCKQHHGERVKRIQCSECRRRVEDSDPK